MKNFTGPLAALADDTRLRLVHLLLQRELCVCELVDALRMPQYKVSRHLRTLRAAGLVEARRDGRWMHYRVNPQADSTGLRQELLRIVGVYLCNVPEVIDDERRLSQRLRLRRAGQCVVGVKRQGASEGRAQLGAGPAARRTASGRHPSRTVH